MVVKENALLPRHTQTISALVSALQRENGQVLVRPPGATLPLPKPQRMTRAQDLEKPGLQ